MRNIAVPRIISYNFPLVYFMTFIYMLCVENYSQRETHLTAVAGAFVLHVKELSLCPGSYHIPLLCSLTLSTPNSGFKESY